ncbi:hypothetical protein E4U42_000281, partial [Claviceps africana]
EARAEPVAGPHAHHHGAGSITGSFTPLAPRGVCTADPLLSASGVHHLVANHQQILSETVYRSFEVPLLHELDKWQTVIEDEEETYQAKIKAQGREVKRMEKEGLKLHKQRRRDVARFRAHLVELTSKLDGLTILHADHSRTLLRESQDTSARIVDASCSLVRAEVDIFESLARKGWSGGGLDDVLEMGTDLFASRDEDDDVVVVVGGGGCPAEGGAAAAGAGAGAGAGPAAANNGHHHVRTSSNSVAVDSSTKLFSILPPKSILADSASDAGSSRLGSARADSLLMDSERYQSLTALATDPKQHGGGLATDPDTPSAFSADFNRPRGPRPFSPQPIRRIPADVTFDSLGAMAEHPCQEGDEPDRPDSLQDEDGPPASTAESAPPSPSDADPEPDAHARLPEGESSANAWGD